MSAADPHLMLAFEGTEVPDWLRQRLEDSPPAGVSLFREWNMTSPGQVAELTSALQEANSSPLPLLIAIDQEGGQLIGLTGSTEFAGNMAIGATGDVDLASQVAVAMGTGAGGGRHQRQLRPCGRRCLSCRQPIARDSIVRR